MDDAQRRQKLLQLLDLAQAYRGWTRKDLAAALGRDPTKLIPHSGVPKLDLVVELARVLDWPIDVVVEALWTDSECPRHPGARLRQRPQPATNGLTLEQYDDQAKAAHREGRYAEMIALARKAYVLAENGDQRAKACNREAGGWDGLGRFSSELEAVQRGMQESTVTSQTRHMLQANLANAYYTLWQLIEAKGAVDDLIAKLDGRSDLGRLERVVRAFAFYVRGNCHRRLLEAEPDHTAFHGGRALADLDRAKADYLTLAEEFDDDSYRGVAHTCEGGILETQTALGLVAPLEVLERFSAALDPLIDPADFPSGDWLESYGWWCIFACNIALRHLKDERDLQQHMAIFTNKADEIANRLDNWAMRERVFTMEFARRQRLVDWTGVASDWMIDSDDLRVITGTMGRFPSFQRTGWQILETARVIKG